MGIHATLETSSPQAEAQHEEKEVAQELAQTLFDILLSPTPYTYKETGNKEAHVAAIFTFNPRIHSSLTQEVARTAINALAQALGAYATHPGNIGLELHDHDGLCEATLIFRDLNRPEQQETARQHLVTHSAAIRQAIHTAIFPEHTPLEATEPSVLEKNIETLKASGNGIARTILFTRSNKPGTLKVQEEQRENNHIERQALAVLRTLQSPENYKIVTDEQGKRRLAARIDIHTTPEGKIRINGEEMNIKGLNEEKIITNVQSLLNYIFDQTEKEHERALSGNEPQTLACKTFRASPKPTEAHGTETTPSYLMYVGNMGVELPADSADPDSVENATLLQDTVDYIATNQRAMTQRIRTTLWPEARYRH